jgi:hypothetical protein
MIKTTQLKKMETNGLDYYSLGGTFTFYVLGSVFANFQGALIIMVGLSTLLYNGLRIYNDFLKKKKNQKN